MNKVFFLGILLPIFTACEDRQFQPADIKGVESQLEELSRSVKGIFADTEVSVEELKKLRQIEYDIIKLPLNASPEEMSKTLTTAGQDRWDCFQAEKTQEDNKPMLLFFCKRPVGTPLRYLPSSLIGR
ncbi:MAG: hypothetical protein IT292_11365 [Deltaproteobacteria bacterium]|nr:hypothetical protein [Deltaproteobacteria bacterium]